MLRRMILSSIDIPVALLKRSVICWTIALKFVYSSTDEPYIKFMMGSRKGIHLTMKGIGI